MSENPEINKLSDKVDGLAVDLGKVSALMNKLDDTIDKMSGLSNEITNLLSIQTNKIANQERISDKFNVVIDDNRKDLLRTLEKLEEKQEQLSKEHFATLNRDLRELRHELRDEMKKYVKTDEFAPIQRAIYAVISLVLTAVAGAVLSLIMK